MPVCPILVPFGNRRLTFEIARAFGGGGHRLAAGYTREGMRPEEAKAELLGVLRNTSVNLGEGR